MTSGNIIPPKAQMVMALDFVVRRSELTVPGHSMKVMAKAASSNADQVMFDLEDACAVSQRNIAILAMLFDGKEGYPCA